LWIEDEVGLIRPLVKGLAIAGCRVDLVTDGATGVSRAGQGAYDVIILDWLLPDLTGAAVLEDFRRAGLRTPVLVLTGHGNEVVAFQAARLGAVAYRTKPIRLPALLSTVRQITADLVSAQTEQAPAAEI
jgi:DNA-binding response OmpR family regulator